MKTKKNVTGKVLAGMYEDKMRYLVCCGDFIYGIWEADILPGKYEITLIDFSEEDMEKVKTEFKEHQTFNYYFEYWDKYEYAGSSECGLTKKEVIQSICQDIEQVVADYTHLIETRGYSGEMVDGIAKEDKIRADWSNMNKEIRTKLKNLLP